MIFLNVILFCSRGFGLNAALINSFINKVYTNISSRWTQIQVLLFWRKIRKSSKSFRFSSRNSLQLIQILFSIIFKDLDSNCTWLVIRILEFVRYSPLFPNFHDHSYTHRINLIPEGILFLRLQWTTDHSEKKLIWWGI